MSEHAIIEVKKDTMRQTKEGSWMLTLALSQEDIPLWLFTAPVGQRMAIAELTIIAEQPQGKPTSGSAPSPSLADAADSPAAATKPERKWDDIPPSQQAGIACADRRFGEWLTQFHDMPVLDGSPSEIAGHLRLVLNLRSRSDLDTNPEAAARWRDLYGKFQTDTRYGDRR